MTTHHFTLPVVIELLDQSERCRALWTCRISGPNINIGGSIWQEVPGTGVIPRAYPGHGYYSRLQGRGLSLKPDTVNLGVWC
ncbi:hypothetical protein ElyMa_006343000 [Elysia marginata]|uniref:Uncharacterized protein n=1 Tax=Elysia marginata TaxID=1093978 RepID=A0AAV4HKL7_9GAST|nr:hypothetical protein ElyMa_006343000 [Elysia marginata]